jgi:threonine dehydrogenase-like Zn-dependent dehydrogenase
VIEERKRAYVRAITVEPHNPQTTRLEDIPEPDPALGSLLVEAIAVGVCGTDVEIVEGKYGWAPRGRNRLVLGHESLGRVLDPGPTGAFQEGELVVGIVRRPDPVPCPSCAVGEWDMCRNGRYTERGIKELHGYGSELWTVETDYAVKLDPRLERVGMLMEPTSVVAKAWDQIERIGNRAYFAPERVLVTGAGPIGLLAALLGAQRGLEVHVLDHNTEGPKGELAGALGAHYHSTDVESVAGEAPPDVIIEATGVPEVVLDAMEHNAAAGVVCLTGVSPRGRELKIDAGGLNRDLVLENDVVFGSVNANERHFDLAAEALVRADASWLEAMISRRVPLDDFASAVEKQRGDVKVVLEL